MILHLMILLQFKVYDRAATNDHFIINLKKKICSFLPFDDLLFCLELQRSASQM